MVDTYSGAHFGRPLTAEVFWGSDSTGGFRAGDAAPNPMAWSGPKSTAGLVLSKIV